VRVNNIVICYKYMFTKGQRTDYAFSEGVLEITVNNPKNGEKAVRKFVKSMKKKGWKQVFGKYLNLSCVEDFKEPIILDYSLPPGGSTRLDELSSYRKSQI
jgi:hypothetical protein